jgi:hypothetical protein
MRRLVPLLLVLSLTLSLSCSPEPGPFIPEPDAELLPPATKVNPPPGPFNGSVRLTFRTDRPATIYVSVDGSDPRTTSRGRLSGPSPLEVTLEATTTVRYFASEGGKDEDLHQDTWTRAGGPVGSIRGVVVVGSFATGQKVGLFRNLELRELGTPDSPTEIPFFFEGLRAGQHRLTAIADRDRDGNLVPFLDFQSDTTTITLDLNDPFKAGPENVRIYLGASGAGLGTLKGVLRLPKPPAFQNLQISVLSPDMLGANLDPMALMQMLQGGYRILTNQANTDYPYVITNLQPGSYLPVPSLMGFGNGGIAINLLAHPLQPARIEADRETTKDFAFGPVAISGEVTVAAAAAPTGFAYGIVAAKTASLTEGIQAVLMPVLLTRDPMTGDAKGRYAGSAFRENSTVSIRVFTNANLGNPLVEALPWVLNPFAAQPPHATVATQADDVVKDILVP